MGNRLSRIYTRTGDDGTLEVDLLVADEPTGDLDRDMAEQILDLLQLVNREQGKTIVMVTHDPKAAERATRQLHLDKGRLMGVQPRAAA